MASIAQPPATQTPPMLGNSAYKDDSMLGARADADLPTFMQTPARPLSAPEPVQLISANDLPDWIRQIAEADEAKAEAAAIQAAEQAYAAPAPINHAIETESKASGPATNWLSKTAAATSEPVDPWTITDSTADRGQPDVPAQPQYAAYPTVTPTPVYMPDPRESAKRSARTPRIQKAEKVAKAEPRTPIYRNTAVQVAFLLLLVVVMAALLV